MTCHLDKSFFFLLEGLLSLISLPVRLLRVYLYKHLHQLAQPVSAELGNSPIADWLQATIVKLSCHSLPSSFSSSRPNYLGNTLTQFEIPLGSILLQSQITFGKSVDVDIKTSNAYFCLKHFTLILIFLNSWNGISVFNPSTSA